MNTFYILSIEVLKASLNSWRHTSRLVVPCLYPQERQVLAFQNQSFHWIHWNVQWRNISQCFDWRFAAALLVICIMNVGERWSWPAMIDLLEVWREMFRQRESQHGLTLKPLSHERCKRGSLVKGASRLSPLPRAIFLASIHTTRTHTHVNIRPSFG